MHTLTSRRLSLHLSLALHSFLAIGGCSGNSGTSQLDTIASIDVTKDQEVEGRPDNAVSDGQPDDVVSDNAPDDVQSDGVKPDNAVSDAPQPDSVKPDNAVSDAPQPDSVKPDNAVSDGAQPDKHTPGPCSITCYNNSINHEPGCDDCISNFCQAQLTACLNDEGSGCLGCAEKYAHQSGIYCPGSKNLKDALWQCMCAPSTCY